MSNQAIPVQSAGWQELFSNGNGVKAVTLALGVMLHATNVYLATTVMPSVINEIGGLEYYAWNTTLFVVASVIGSVLSANRMAALGPRKAYQFAIVVFSAGTLLCSLAPAMYVLLMGRFVQGLGGGLLFALTYAMIRIVFLERLWARAMALVSGMWGVAAFSGPFIGGVFAEQGHWRMSFACLLIVCAGIFIVTSLILPNSKSVQVAPKVPYLKLLMLVLAALSVSVGSVFDSTGANLLGVLLAIMFMGVLIAQERKGGIPLLPTGAYRLSSLGITYAVMTLLAIATSVEIFVPYFAQVINGFSPLQSGYLTVLIAVGWTLASIIFSGAKQGKVHRVIMSGLLIVLIGLAGLCFISLQNNTASGVGLVLNCVFLFAIGAGIGMGWPHLLTRVFALAPKGEEELAAASVTTVQLMATTFGAALAGLVSNIGGISIPGGIEGAINASVLLYGSFAVAPLAAVLLWMKGKRN